MCIRVRVAPRDQITDPYDAERQTITIPENLGHSALFAIQAVRAVLCGLGVEQDNFGALCWCGEEIDLRPAVSTQRRSDEVIHLGA